MVIKKLASLFKKSGTSLNCNHKNLTPEQDIQIAESEFIAGNLKHAAYHVGCALVTDANRREWLQVLDKICDIADDPLSLAPMEERNYAGTVAVRAYILHRLRRTSEAVDLIMQTITHLPKSGYIQWAINWLHEPESAGKVNCKPIVGYFGRMLDDIPKMNNDPDIQRVLIRRIPDLVFTAFDSQNLDPQSVFAFALVLKRLNNLDLLKEFAQKAYNQEKNYHTANAMASAYRAKGQLDQAIEMYREAARFDPSDNAVYLDEGDLLMETGRFPEAADAYNAALAINQNDPWALPSYYAAQFKATGDLSWKLRLDQYLSANPSNDQARRVRELIEKPYFGSYLPEPSEATVNAGRHMLEKNMSPRGKIGLSSPEAASALPSLIAEFSLRNSNVDITIETSVTSGADPRLPHVPVDYTLWTFQGFKAIPALPPPSAPILTAVHRVAVLPYDFDTWLAKAKGEAAAIDPGKVQEMLGAMVNPGDPQVQTPAWNWWQSVQFAAAFMIAQIDTGWANSIRRSLLLSVVNGPMDWTVTAAIVALVHVAHTCPESQEEIKALFLDLDRHAHQIHGYVCYRNALLLSMLEMPNFTETEKERIRTRLMQMEQDQ